MCPCIHKRKTSTHSPANHTWPLHLTNFRALDLLTFIFLMSFCLRISVFKYMWYCRWLSIAYSGCRQSDHIRCSISHFTPGSFKSKPEFCVSSFSFIVLFFLCWLFWHWHMLGKLKGNVQAGRYWKEHSFKEEPLFQRNHETWLMALNATNYRYKL